MTRPRHEVRAESPPSRSGPRTSRADEGGGPKKREVVGPGGERGSPAKPLPKSRRAAAHSGVPWRRPSGESHEPVHHRGRCYRGQRRPRPTTELGACMDRGMEICRSLWDRDALVAHLDIEYVNFDFPGEAYRRPERIFDLQTPVIDATEKLLRACGYPKRKRRSFRVANLAGAGPVQKPRGDWPRSTLGSAKIDAGACGAGKWSCERSMSGASTERSFSNWPATPIRP